MGSDSIFWSTLAIGHTRSGLLLEAGKLQVLRRVLQKVVVGERLTNSYASVSRHDQPGPLSETGDDCTLAEVVKVIELMLMIADIDRWLRLSRFVLSVPVAARPAERERQPTRRDHFSR
jgi:hypothetical protein